jgi:hypothetical protein
MLYHGPVRVPADARPGSAIISVELPKGCGYTSLRTDIAVKLVGAKAPEKK